MTRIIFFIICLLFFFFEKSNAQSTSFSHEISIRFDNDFFAARGTDKYYTTGLYFTYSSLAKSKKSNITKKITSYEVGQSVYTPGQRNVYVVKELDRPITGYLYAKMGMSYYKTNNRMFKWGATIGTVGPAALGQQILDAFHPFIKINSEYWDWMFAYQLKNGPGINVQGSYAMSLLKKEGWLQITPLTNVSLGTSMTHLSQSVVLRLGKENALHQSAFWGSRLQYADEAKPAHKWEVFGYYQPELMLQLYNATIQGGMFIKDKGGILSKPEPVVISHRMGVMLANNRYTAGFHLTYQGKESKSQFDNHIYGGINLAYRFR